MHPLDTEVSIGTAEAALKTRSHTESHRITAWLWWEELSGNHLIQPSCSSRVT